jgi:hypothetical protein
MSPTGADPARADRDHLIHALHHPVDAANTIVFGRGCGAIVHDTSGRAYIEVSRAPPRYDAE